MLATNPLLLRALDRLCSTPGTAEDRANWQELLLGTNAADLNWLKRKLPAFLAGPPDTLNCFIAAVLFLRHHYTAAEAFEASERNRGVDSATAEYDHPRYRYELFTATLNFIKHGLPHRERDPMRECALIYCAVVAAGTFVGGEKKNAWVQSPGNLVICQEMQLRYMQFATLSLDDTSEKRPQLVADVHHPLLHMVRLVIPNAKADGTVKVRIDTNQHLVLRAGAEIIYFTDIVDRFSKQKPPRNRSVVVTPVASLHGLKTVSDRSTAVFPTCAFVR